MKRAMILLVLFALSICQNPIPVPELIQREGIPATSPFPTLFQTLNISKDLITIDEQGNLYMVTIPLNANQKKPEAVQQSAMIRENTRRVRNEDTPQGYIPSHLNQQVKLDSARQVSCGSLREKRTIFGQDDRSAFFSTNYPYSTIGRLETSNATLCTGTMIDKNLVLTASHCIPWSLLPDVWMSFTPMYYQGEKPFGRAYATHVYAIFEAPNRDVFANESAFDLAILKLESDLGNTTGWAGAKLYNEDWNGGNFWINVGYPVDCFLGELPVVSFNGSILGSYAFEYQNETAYYLATRIDLVPGHSGGPFFTYFGGEDYISVIGVTSSGSEENNAAAGGPVMIELINYAKNQSQYN